jgi:hypothetical protein
MATGALLDDLDADHVTAGCPDAWPAGTRTIGHPHRTMNDSTGPR